MERRRDPAKGEALLQPLLDGLNRNQGGQGGAQAEHVLPGDGQGLQLALSGCKLVHDQMSAAIKAAAAKTRDIDEETCASSAPAPPTKVVP